MNGFVLKLHLTQEVLFSAAIVRIDSLNAVVVLLLRNCKDHTVIRTGSAVCSVFKYLVRSTGTGGEEGVIVNSKHSWRL
jgi:hypothetical protein